MSGVPGGPPDSVVGLRRDRAEASGKGMRWLWAALPLIVAFVATCRVRLNGDVDYALGTIETAGRGGVGVGEVFGARPFAYRVLVDGLDGIRRLVDDSPGSTPTDDLVIRLLAVALVAIVGLLLWRALRRHLAAPVAGAVAVTVTGSLAVAPPWHFLEPDWVAVVSAVLGVALALLPRRDWLAAIGGGLALTLTVAVKLATAPWAVIALVAIALVARRRAVTTAAAWLALVAGWLAATRVAQPWELTWLADQARLASDSPLHHGVRLGDLLRLTRTTANAVIVSPLLVAALPAAAVLVRRSRGRDRILTTTALLAGGALSLVSAYAQGEYFQYHLAGLPVVGAAVWAVAMGGAASARLPLATTTVAASVASAVLLSRPLAWRVDHLAEAVGIQLLVAVVGTAWAVSASRGGRMPPRRLSLMLGAAAAAALVVPLLPTSHYAFGQGNAEVRVGRSEGAVERAERAYDDLRARIGGDTRVTYLAYGSILRQLGNPTTCRYPSPQWLQRAATEPESPVRSLASYADNLSCLTDDGGARYVVWQPGWFPLDAAPAEVRAYVAGFDCSADGRVPAPAGLVVCPRRAR